MGDEEAFVRATCGLWQQIAYNVNHSEWPALDLCRWSCDSSKNFVGGAAYSQQSLTNYCPDCSGSPVYGGGNDNEKAVAYCKDKCERGVSPASPPCVGFFYQRHTNGHEICGFYNAALNWGDAQWHGHAAGSRICKLTRS